MLTLFLLSTVLFPYTVYTLLAPYLNWHDRRKKAPIRHANEVTSALLLGTTIYFVGGYKDTFHWAIPASTLGSILCYGFMSEFAPLQTSLKYIHTWPWQMWTVTGTSILIVLGFAIFHVLFAVKLWGIPIAIGGYLGSFALLPLFTAMLVYGLAQTERTHLGTHDFELENGDEEEEEEEEAILHHDTQDHELGNDSDEEDVADDDDDVDALRTLPPRPIRRTIPRPVKTRRRLRIHLHHYQIFAYLSFFTRFPTVWSRLAAGLALGCMMHGIAAYGVDSLFEYEED